MQIDNAKDLDDMMPIYNLIEYNDNYSKSLFIFCRDEPNNPITDSELFQFKGRITRITTVLSTYTSSISTNIIVILFLTVLERIFTVDGKSYLPVDFLVNNL